MANVFGFYVTGHIMANNGGALCRNCDALARKHSFFCGWPCERERVLQLERHYKPPRHIAEAEGVDWAIPNVDALMAEFNRKMDNRISDRFRFLEID